MVRFSLISLLTGILLLSGCAAQKTLYNWDQYQPAVYSYLQEGDLGLDIQVEAMEENIETAASKDQALPPGFHAHLGMLYAQQGHDDLALEQLELEQELFPESSTFITLLLSQQTEEIR